MTSGEQTRGDGSRADRPSGPAGSGLPPGVPLPAAAQTLVMWRWPLAYLDWCRARYGTRFTVRMTGFPPLVFLSDPSDVRGLLAAPVDALKAGEGGAITTPIVGAGSFMLQDGAQHLAGRKAVLAAFHRRAVGGHEQMVAEVARRAVATWPHDTPCSLHPRLRALTLEVILRKTLMSSADDRDDRLRALCEAILEMLAITGSAVFPEPILRHGPGRTIWRRFLRSRAAVDELIYELIDERRGAHREGPADDALDALAAASNDDGSPRSRQQLRDNVMSLILAGHETTAAQLSWAFQLLAHNPAVLHRLIAEIDRGEDDEYLSATIQEVLRHRPVFLFAIPRVVCDAVAIGDWSYSPPAQLLGCIYLVHHDPALYPQPHAFRPERFLSAFPQPHAWLPWGGGHKRCPGLHLATLEMKTVLRAVLSDTTIQAAARTVERPRWRSVIVTPHAGSRVVLRARARRPHPSSLYRSAA